MTNLELTDHDKAALAAVLRATIAADRYPLSPRVRQLRAILERLEPPRTPRHGATGGAHNRLRVVELACREKSATQQAVPYPISTFWPGLSNASAKRPTILKPKRR